MHGECACEHALYKGVIGSARIACLWLKYTIWKQWSHNTTPRYGEYHTHAHSHNTRAVAAMDSAHLPSAAEASAKHSFKRQLHVVNVVAVAATVQDSLGNAYGVWIS